MEDAVIEYSESLKLAAAGVRCFNTVDGVESLAKESRTSYGTRHTQAALSAVFIFSSFVTSFCTCPAKF